MLRQGTERSDPGVLGRGGGGRQSLESESRGRSQGALQPIRGDPEEREACRWRLIVDLSTPDGGSVNEGMNKEWSSLHYMFVDHVVEQVLKVCRGAEMAKADVKKAYRNVPVHPDDRWLLGMEWQGATFVDGILPFGLRSAPLLFTALGDALE